MIFRSSRRKTTFSKKNRLPTWGGGPRGKPTCHEKALLTPSEQREGVQKMDAKCEKVGRDKTTSCPPFSYVQFTDNTSILF